MNTHSETTGTKHINLTLDSEPNKYLYISDANLNQKWFQDKLQTGTVWVVRAKQYDFDMQQNHYVLQRVDYNATL